MRKLKLSHKLMIAGLAALTVLCFASVFVLKYLLNRLI